LKRLILRELKFIACKSSVSCLLLNKYIVKPLNTNGIDNANNYKISQTLSHAHNTDFPLVSAADSRYSVYHSRHIDYTLSHYMPCDSEKHPPPKEIEPERGFNNKLHADGFRGILAVTLFSGLWPESLWPTHDCSVDVLADTVSVASLSPSLRSFYVCLL
jgi:hypothetical protein